MHVQRNSRLTMGFLQEAIDTRDLIVDIQLF